MLRSFTAALLLVAVARSADAQILPSFRLTRDFRIDPATADLSEVGRLMVARSGEILVAQPEDADIRWFAADGGTGTIGRPGAGPGEFRRLTRIGFIGDSIWAFDVVLKRISIFGPDHKFVRSYPMPTSVFAHAGDAANPAIESYVQVVHPDGTLRVLLNIRPGTGRPSWATDVDSGMSLMVRVGPDGVLKNRIALVPADPCTVSFTFGKGNGETTIPFCFTPVSTDWNESVLVARVTGESSTGARGSYHVSLVDPNGTVIFSRSYAYTPRAVTSSEIDSFQARREKSLASMPPNVVAAMPRPAPARTHPPIRKVVVGEDRTVWLEVDTPSPQHLWRILDPRGTPVGEVVLPANISLEIASRRTIWGIETDADGLEGIVRYQVGPGR